MANVLHEQFFWPGFVVQNECKCNILGWKQDLNKKNCYGCGKELGWNTYTLIESLEKCAMPGCDKTANAVPEACDLNPYLCMYHAEKAVVEVDNYLNGLSEDESDVELPAFGICRHSQPQHFEEEECPAIQTNVVTAFSVTNEDGSTTVVNNKTRTSRRIIDKFRLKEASILKFRRLKDAERLQEACVEALRLRRRLRHEKREAFCMASHERLGRGSAANVIVESSLFEMISRFTDK